MLDLQLSQVKARCWRGYHKNKTGWLPKRMSWMEPEAATDFERMNEACGHRIEYTDVYRSSRLQIQAIKTATKKRRLFAPPTKSGHNFGFSFDAKISETLENFRKSKVPELVIAGRDRQSLVRWMMRFGWSGIKKESWHFNHLGSHGSTVKKIDAVYGAKLALNNEDVQRALNKLVGQRLAEPLAIDGILGTKSGEAASLSYDILGYDDQGAFSGWYRRLLAGATATITEVSECSQSTSTS